MARTLSLLLAVLIAGCGADPSDDPGPSTTADSATADATSETVTDTGSDPPVDATPEAASDAPAETAVDASSEAATDALAPPCTEPGGKVFTGNGHCYFPLATTRPLVGASTDCKGFKAYIVTITSAAENDFVKTIGTGERWIGLTSKVLTTSKTDFDWLGGEAVTYDGWNVGSPASRGRCAVQLAGGRWEDRSCSDELKIGICERE